MPPKRLNLAVELNEEISSVLPGRRLLYRVAQAAVRWLKHSEKEDPLCIFFWNEQRLAELDATINTPEVQNQLRTAGVGHAPDTKSALLAFMDMTGGHQIGPEEARQTIRFFREQSEIVHCLDELVRVLPYAHVLRPGSARALNMPVQEPVATSLVVSRTERVKPDVSEGFFFYF